MHISAAHFQKLLKSLSLNLLMSNQVLTTHRRSYYRGGVLCPPLIAGIEHLTNNRLNKGLGFTYEERQRLGIHGLLPPVFKTQEQQVERCKILLSRIKDDGDKFKYLVDLHERNERLFFRLVCENIYELLPIVYTPTVAKSCLECGLYYRNPRGLFVSIHDKGHVFEVISNWPEPNVKAVVCTDGERILGLGDLGACGNSIPVGKLGLYTAIAGIPPHMCLPITIDVGTNNEKFLNDPLYFGLRQKRVRGQEYNEFMDELMAALVKRYGQNILIQFEDFGNTNAFRHLEKYRHQYCCFNDDIQGTAGAGLAGLLTCERLTKKKVKDYKILFLGAGEAAIGIAEFCVLYVESMEGGDQRNAREKIWMFDVDGLVAKDRPEGTAGSKGLYAKDHPPEKNFEKLVNEVKPDVLIGVCTVGGLFTPSILKAMATFSERPIVFALSNPTSHAECTPQEAYDHTEGRVLYSSGSPFGPIKYNGKEYQTGQGNNAFVYPAVALGVIVAGIQHIDDELFLIGAKAVADNVSDEVLQKGGIYPPLRDLRKCSIQTATKICEYAYQKGIATLYPEPKSYTKYIEDWLYKYEYEDVVPPQYQWPEKAKEPKEMQLTTKLKSPFET